MRQSDKTTYTDRDRSDGHPSYLIHDECVENEKEKCALFSFSKSEQSLIPKLAHICSFHDHCLHRIDNSGEQLGSVSMPTERTLYSFLYSSFHRHVQMLPENIEFMLIFVTCKNFNDCKV